MKRYWGTPGKYFTYIVVSNFILFGVLAVFFEGGAFPWGEIKGGNFYVSSNIATATVSSSWFWLTYWQGLSAWAGMGIYGVVRFALEAINAEDENREVEARNHKYGVGFMFFWLLIVLGNGIAIVYF